MSAQQDAVCLVGQRYIFSGVNMLKGASLRPLNLLLLQRAQYVTIETMSVAPDPLSCHCAPRCATERMERLQVSVIKALGGRTTHRQCSPYGKRTHIEIKRSRSKDMSAPKTSYPNIPSSYGIWNNIPILFRYGRWIHNYVQIFIGYTRDGEAYLSEIQLEEGTKATAWKILTSWDVERTASTWPMARYLSSSRFWNQNTMAKSLLVVSKGKALLWLGLIRETVFPMEI